MSGWIRDGRVRYREDVVDGLDGEYVTLRSGDGGRTWPLEGLQVLGTTGGGLFDATGSVAFRAHHRGGVVAEDSAFRREAGRWFYVGPVSDPFTTAHRRWS